MRLERALLLFTVLAFSPCAQPLLAASRYHVDVDNAAACPCTDPRTPPSGCGTRDNPFSCIAHGVLVGGPGDTVLVQDGTYLECLGITHGGTSAGRLTIEAANSRKATISAAAGCEASQVVYFGPNADYVTLRGFNITGATTSTLSVGVYIAEGSDHNTLENLGVEGNGRGIQIRGTDGATVSRCDIGPSTLYEGIKVEGTTDTLIENSRIHHSEQSGILETPIGETDVTGTIIRGCLIHDNGRYRHAAGLYLKGKEGTVADNCVWGNSGYGIHLWSGPVGSRAKPYLVERNDVSNNGFPEIHPVPCGDLRNPITYYYTGGIVLGGDEGESPLPDPERGIPRYVELRYNTIHHNNGLGFSYYLTGCGKSDEHNTFHHNTVYGNRRTQIMTNFAENTDILLLDNIVMGANLSDSLIEVFRSNLAADAWDGDLFWRVGSTSAADTISWNGDVYSFDEITRSGVVPNPGCEPHPTGKPSVAMLTHGSWQKRPEGKAARASRKSRPPGVATATATIPREDGWPVPTDLDHDGVPALSGDCDDNDPRVYAGAHELCDGKNNDCTNFPAVPADELDADGDGYFACMGKCDDHFTQQKCDCDDTSACTNFGNTSGCPRDAAFQATPKPGTTVGGGVANLTGAWLENAYETLRETPAPVAGRLTAIWTFSGLVSGADYELRVEGFRVPARGNNTPDDFRFSFAAVTGPCASSSPFGDTVLTVTKEADDDTYQSASLGTIGTSTVCVRVVDSDTTRGDKKMDDLVLDRLFLVKRP